MTIQHQPTKEHHPLTRALAAWLAGLMLGGFPCATWAGPQGEQVVNGQVQVIRQGDHTLIQASDGSIIQYQGFDVLKHESVQFLQPDAASRVLNRIQGRMPSQIDGALLANGKVYLVNPAGIRFGPDAFVNVGALYAAAGAISDADFAARMDRFTNLQGEVVNLGSISADVVALIGKQVANLGSISAQDGLVALVAGDEVVLIPAGEPLRVKVAGGGAAGVASPGVTNAGTIDAGEGAVDMAAGDLYSLAVRQEETGSVHARDIAVQGGDGGVVHVSGTLDASADGAGETGGTIHVLGDKVALTDATLDASGPAGGGEILVGGNWQGHGPERNAEVTYVGRDVLLRADATQSGDGGKVIVWADGATRFYGDVSARGGAAGGDGGFAEVSGKRHLAYDGITNLGAERGRVGTLLLDPDSIRVTNTAAGTGNDLPSPPVLTAATAPGTTDVSRGSLEAQVADISLLATNDVTIDPMAGDLGGTSVANTLNLKAGLTVRADSDGVGGGDFAMTVTDTIKAPGKTVAISGASVITGTIDTSGGADQAGGDVTLTALDPSGAGGVQTRDITSRGGAGSAGNPGAAGGDVRLTSGGALPFVVVNGSIVTDGGAGAGTASGGEAGTIVLQGAGGAASSTRVDGDISAKGGAPGAAPGVAGANGEVSVAGLLGLTVVPAATRTVTGRNVTFSDAVDATGAALTVNATGLTTFSKDVGALSIATDAPGSTQIGVASGSAVTFTTTGPAGQVLGDDVTLANDLTSVAGAGALRFKGTLGRDATPRAYTSQTTGTTAFEKSVGGASPGTALRSVTIGAGPVEIGAVGGGPGNVDVRTTGTQQYGAALTLNQDATLTTSTAASDVTFASNVSARAGEAHGLTVASAGAVSGAATAIDTNGGDARLTGTTVTVADIDTSAGATDRDGGVANVSATMGDATTGNIDTRGGTAPSAAGRSGGGVTLSATSAAADVTAGNVDTRGSKASNAAVANENGGAGGDVVLAAGEVLAVGGIDTSGGAADGGGVNAASGGAAGGISFASTTGTTTTGNLTAKAGTGVGGAAAPAAGAPVVFNGALVLEAIRTIDGGDKDVQFKSRVDSDSDATNRNLSIATTGTTTFGDGVGPDFVGSNGRLGKLESTGPGAVVFNVFASATNRTPGAPAAATQAQSVRTAGEQAYSGPVRLAQNTVLESTGAGAAGDVRFSSTVNGSAPGTQSLEVNTAGTTRFDARVGNATSLGSLTTDAATSAVAGGSTRFDVTLGGGQSTVLTAEAQTYGDDVVIAQDSVLGTTNGAATTAFDIAFRGAVNAAAPGVQALTVSTAGTTRFGDGDASDKVGATALRSLTTDGSAVATDQTLIDIPGAGGAGDRTISTTGSQVFGDAVVLGQSIAPVSVTRFDSTAGGVSFARTVDANLAANERSVQVNAPNGAVDFGGAVGGAQPLESLDVVASMSTRLAESVRLRDGIGAAPADALHVKATNAIVLGGGPGTNPLYSTNANAVTGNAGNVRLEGKVQLAEDLTIDAAASGTSGNVRFAESVDTQPGATADAGLVVSTAGETRFDAPVGATLPLASLTTSAGGTTVFDNLAGATAVITSGSQFHGDRIDARRDTTFVAGNGQFLVFGGPLVSSAARQIAASAPSGGILIGASSDAAQRLTGLTLGVGNTGLIEFGPLATEIDINGDLVLNNVVRPVVPTNATIFKRSGNLSLTGVNVTMAEREKLTVIGNLAIKATGTARIGDLNGFAVNVEAGTIAIQPRPPAPANGIVGNDKGADIVGNQVTLKAGAYLGVSAADRREIGTPNGSVDDEAKVFLGAVLTNPDSLGFLVRAAFNDVGARIEAQDLQIGDTVLDLAPGGPKTVENTQQPPPPVQTVNVLQPLEDLNVLAVSQRPLREDEVSAFLECDADDKQCQAEAVGEARAQSNEADQLRASFDKLFGGAAPGPAETTPQGALPPVGAAPPRSTTSGNPSRESLTRAVDAYRTQFGTEPGGLALRQFVESSPSHADALAVLDDLAAVFTQARELGMTSTGLGGIKRNTLSKVVPDGMSIDTLESAVEAGGVQGDPARSASLPAPRG